MPRTVGAPESGSAREDRLLLCNTLRQQLASLVPASQRDSWHLLFNSDLMGKSFATCMGSVFDRGPTLLLVRAFVSALSCCRAECALLRLACHAAVNRGHCSSLESRPYSSRV